MNINGNVFTIGADPEIFVGKDGEFVSAHGMVEGTKIKPHEVEGGAVQVDGMALEFNIDPAENYEEFQHLLDSVQEQLLDMISVNGFDFLKETTVHFDQELFDKVPIANKMLGCEPDFNAWTMEVNEKPSYKNLMRTVGGHAHIGGFFSDNLFNKEHFEKGATLARLMDEEVGVYSLLWDKDDERRSMYGSAGCFRPKPYGMEYRSLSNAWLFSKDITKFVFDGTQRALQRLCDGDKGDNEGARDIINNSDRDNVFFKDNELAKDLM